MSIYKIIELVGSSHVSWEDAAQEAIEAAKGELEDLRIAEITKLDMKLEDGGKIAYRARVKVSFKVHGFKKYAETLGPKSYAVEEE